MTDIDVPDWVVDQFATIIFDTQGLDWPEDFPECAEDVRAQIRAALSAWVVHRGVTYFDTRDSSLPTQVDWNHPEPGAKENVYTLRQEKPE